MSYGPPLKPGSRAVVESGPGYRHDEQAEDKGQHHDQPGKFSKPVTDLSPLRQMTHLIKRVAQAIRSELASLQDADRVANGGRA